MAEPDGLHEINRTLGTLIGKVDGLALDVSESRHESKEHRQRVYDRLEENEAAAEKAAAIVLARLDALEAAAASTKASLAEIKPVVDAVTVWKQRGIGAIAVVGLACTLLGVGIASKWDAVKAAWSGMFGN